MQRRYIHSVEFLLNSFIYLLILCSERTVASDFLRHNYNNAENTENYHLAIIIPFCLSCIDTILKLHAETLTVYAVNTKAERHVSP